MAAELAIGPAALAASPRASLVEQTLAVARRAVVRTARQRALIIFPMIFPLILFAINGSALSTATRIPGFPTHNYRDFLIAMPFVQGAMFVSISAGVDLAKDIETGFLSRLAMTPVRGEALLVGQLGGALVLGVIQAFVYLLVGLATGVTLASGVGGAIVLLLLSILISFAFASLGVLLALRFGSGEAVQGIFPLLFVTIFLVLLEPAAQPDQGELVSRRRHLQPGLLPARGAAQPGHHRLGHAGAGARVRLRARPAA